MVRTTRASQIARTQQSTEYDIIYMISYIFYDNLVIIMKVSYDKVMILFVHSTYFMIYSFPSTMMVSYHMYAKKSSYVRYTVIFMHWQD